MNFGFKLALSIFITGAIALLLVSYITYKYNLESVIASQCKYTESVATVISKNFEQLLIEKTKIVLTLANTPLIKNALDESNISYKELTESNRKELINQQDRRWKGINNTKDPFILNYIDNGVSRYFKEQQSTMKAEYGEVFLTNKFGALVASTSKLSTFAHGHKYWWSGSYNNERGAIFFDDRGYDNSVAGYVLGVVVPVKNGKDITGILKCNLNILGAINKLILSAKNNLIGNFKIVRSGGTIVFEEHFEPLSTQVPNAISEKLNKKSNGSLIINVAGNKWMVGLSEINLTSGQKGYRFGGNFSSVDHKKGNTGESWYILNFRDMNTVLLPVIATTKTVATIIFFVTCTLAFVALLIGHRVARPLTNLTDQIRKVAKGNFGARIHSIRKDEFGTLARAFNNMARDLSKTTTSIEALESEVSCRQKSESEKEHVIIELKGALKQVRTLDGLLPICANCKNIRDDRGYWQKVEKYVAERSEVAFSHSVCPECIKKLYPDLNLNIES